MGIQYFNRGGYRLRRHPPLKYNRCPSIMHVVTPDGQNKQTNKSHLLSLIVSFSCLKIIDKLINSSLRYCIVTVNNCLNAIGKEAKRS